MGKIDKNNCGLYPRCTMVSGGCECDTLTWSKYFKKYIKKFKKILDKNNLNKKKQQKMTKSKTSSKSKKSTKVQKVKIETTPSGTYRVRKSSNGVVVNRSFKKKKDATTFRDALYA